MWSFADCILLTVTGALKGFCAQRSDVLSLPQVVLASSTPLLRCDFCALKSAFNGLTQACFWKPEANT
jgi:hypothetical protein